MSSTYVPHSLRALEMAIILCQLFAIQIIIQEGNIYKANSGDFPGLEIWEPEKEHELWNPSH